MFEVGQKISTPEGQGIILDILDAVHPVRVHNPTGWTYTDGSLVAPNTTLYVITLRNLTASAVYTEEELFQ